MAQAFGVWKVGQQTWSNGRCGVLLSEITTPAGAQESVLLNDSLDPSAEYVAEVVTPPAGATFFELEWDGSFEYSGPVPNSFTYRVREWGAHVGPDLVSVTILAPGAIDPDPDPTTSTVKFSVSGAWLDAEIMASSGSVWSPVEIRHYSGEWTPL